MKTELNNKTADELNQQLIDLLREQFNLRMQKGVGDVPRPHLYKQVRRNIARVKTFINRKEQEK
jgi:large subunit ribosomal protein L29